MPEQPIVPQILPEFALINISPEQLVWGIVMIVAVVFVIYSLFLLYHALRYGEGAVLIFGMLIAYFGISVVLLSTIVTAAALIT